MVRGHDDTMGNNGAAALWKTVMPGGTGNLDIVEKQTLKEDGANMNNLPRARVFKQFEQR